MATASGGRVSLVTPGSSSFSQFRLTQFIPENAPKVSNATPDTHQPSLAISSEDLDSIQMAQSSRPSSGQNIDRTSSTANPRPIQQDESQPNSSSPAVFGTLALVELANNPIIEGILGANKDGRVRNPTPSKLKGKTDNKLGNFGVMQMGMSPGGAKGKNETPGKDVVAAERDAAARRTSENTASRAKAAQVGKYVPPKRRGFEGMNDSQLNRVSPFASGKDDKQRSRSLAPDETKFEQARLLTLLRSINPVTVVDQICKAVAYFGGIPGAPPPEDGIFPESANTRETGALFIGWVAEIFPDLSSPEVPKIQEAPGGRKSKMRPGRGGGNISGEAPNPRNGFGYGQAVSAPAWGLPQSLSLVNTIGANSSPEVANSSPEQTKVGQPRPATPIKQQPDDAPPHTGSTSKRGRGRPKGSRNRKAGSAQASGQQTSEPQAFGNGNIQIHNQANLDGQPHQSPEVPVQPPPARVEKTAQPDPPAYVPQAADQTSSKPAQILQYPEHSWQINARKNNVEQPTPAPPLDELSPEERAVLEAFRQPVPMQQVSTASPNLMTSKAPPAGGVKRKRVPNKSKPSIPPPQSNTATETPQAGQVGQSGGGMQHMNDIGTGIGNNTVQWSHVGASTSTPTPAAPPPKRQRQRKPKAPSTNEPPSQTQTASVTSGTPTMAPSTIPDSTATSSQQSIPVSRPPAEGLEAHYERFATMPQQALPQQTLPQQNGRTHSPSITPGQQLRQQQKPTSVTPQSQQSPAQQQSHMARQKSQSGIQRDDQKIGQGTAVRSSSSGGYYSQRSQGTAYSQQYPSQQPSQLYGSHQASPQMSTNNSFRTSSTHTLAQASPQFSSTTDTTYKTASPHTISQPQPSPSFTPSFTQPDNTFRTPTTHSLVQPSPTYSQPESTYRTTSTHSITQPSPAYSRPSQSQTQSSHQSHYNHFSDNAYIDLPTLDSLGHSGSSSSNVGLSGGVYGSSLPSALGNNASSRSGSNSLYGTSSGLNNTYDSSANDLLRSAGASRSTGGNSVYGTSSSLGPTAFDTGSDDMRERIMKNIGGYNRR